MDKIVILHVFNDEKFFEGVSCFFDSLKNVINKYCFYTKEKNYQFKYIKSISKIRIYNNFEEYSRLFSDKEINVIYFHSLYFDKYKFFKYISKDKKVIWWCFGADIYYGIRGLKPLINLNLYKPLTLQHIECENKHLSLRRRIKKLLKSLSYFYFKKLQNDVIKRIDYFSPVLPIEYELLKENPNFKAKPFMLNAGPGIYIPKSFTKVKNPLNVLIGNSLTYTNNHLDIFHELNAISLDHNRKYIIPISYGNDFKNQKEYFKKSLKSQQVLWLEDFIPFSEYSDYLNSVTHAIFGHIRQQSMGNIIFCLVRGVKIFLYSDSIIYKQLKKFGYIVFTIDYDLDENSLNTVLTDTEAYNNYRIYNESIKYRTQMAEKELYKMI